MRQLLFLGTTAATEAATRFNAVSARFGLPWRASSSTTLASADRIIAVGTLVENVESWPDASDERINQLIAVLLGGGGSVPEPEPVKPTPAKESPPLKVGRETKGRKGKGVTLVWDIPLDEAGIRALATKLKERCGTGGTVEGERIVIQGDQRERVIAELEKLGYRVKRVGG